MGEWGNGGKGERGLANFSHSPFLPLSLSLIISQYIHTIGQFLIIFNIKMSGNSLLYLMLK